MSRKVAKPVKQVYPLRDLEKPEGVEPVTGGWASGKPIAIDLGTYRTRVGYAGDSKDPEHVFYSQVAKYRDRKAARTFQLIGNDILLDSSARQNMRSPFDGQMVSNWELVESILDYSFAKLSVGSNDCVDNPVVMNEVLGCPASHRRNMNELMFEAYQVPSVVYGIDSLYSFRYNSPSQSNGLVISSGHEVTTIIPVIDGQGALSLAKRINWGGKQSSAYLQSLLSLKYPLFPTKITQNQTALMVHDHCYVSKNYAEENARILDFEGLEDRERVVEAPYTQVTTVEKSEEELARLAEKRKESGRRLQEQAAKARLEKLIERERQLEAYKELQQRVENGPKKEVKKTLDREGFRDEAQLQKEIAELEKSIRRARKLDVGDDADDQPPSFPLVDVPDEELDEAQIKEKRKQKLMKANYEARLRAKEEKEIEKKQQEEEERKDAEWRERDLEGWLNDRREKLQAIFDARREKQRLKEELTNRKSQAAQNRMKNIAALASDGGRTRRKRGRGDDDPDDTFGADDNDWAVYRDISKEDDSEEEEEEERNINQLTEQLQKHDPEFRLEDYSRERGAIDWKDSVIHMFLRGPREFEQESQAQMHQLCLNVERIRVPEVMFQPSIAGVDQAGIVEICDDILLQRLQGGPSNNQEVLKNIFLTGGQAHFENFDERVHRELQSILPVGSPLKVRKAADPSNDSWRGMAQWATTPEFSKASVSKQEYEEMGSEYMKEHGYGNSYV